MGFKPSRADPDIWMKSSKDASHYEYIAVYVDDLAICMKDPNSFYDTLKEKYKLKLKGVGPINYHLGCGYTRDEDGTPVADPRKYVEEILESYEKTFGEKPKKTKAPLVGGDHPESGTSDFCDQDQTKQYQTIVGQLIWLAGLGRFDIAVHVMTMSRFRQQPRIGHLERLKKRVGYLANFPHGAFVEKSVFSIWIDLFLCRSIQLLVLSYAEMFVYMYLSQLMSTFTKLSKGASSSRWFLHSMTRRTSDPTITHMYLYTHVSQI